MKFLDKLVGKGVTFDKKKTLTNVEPVAQEEAVEVEQPTLDVSALDPNDAAAAILFRGQQPVPATEPEPVKESWSLGGSTLGHRNVLVIVPRTQEAVTEVVKNLQAGEVCIINLEPLPKEEATRRLDVLTGVVCTIGGHMHALDEFKYVLTPQGLGVRA